MHLKFCSYASSKIKQTILPTIIRSLLAKNASCAVLTRKNIVIFQNNTMQLDDKSFITN